MRQGTLFARLRGKDGRSLARALVLLVLVGLFAGGLNAGAAATGGDTAFCLVNGGKGKLPAPAHDHKPDCCILGPTPLALALSPSPLRAVAPSPAGTAVAWREAVPAISGPIIGRPTARGPPLRA